MDCEKVRVDIKRVGTISVGSEHYTIYNLHYKTVPEFPGAQPHGGQRILVFADLGEKTYLGQYSITPWHELRVVGVSLESDFSTLEGNEIFFAADGPPEKIHFGGDVLKFYK